ncbi:MAG TPA: glycosyltransferase family 39 protein [Thermomicrobiaceae bacterium]|nr:glycosyltransferase family 39 protein [Thermomicrobiaceae bacterium]
MIAPRHRFDPAPLQRPHLALPAALLLLTALALGLGLSPTRGAAGLLEAEARNGLLARAAAGHGAALLDPAPGSSPLLAALGALFGRALGFDVQALRLAALTAGLGTALCTGLWLRRLFEAPWGAAGALMVAGSAPLLAYSRVALSPVAGALALAATLWLLAEADARACARPAWRALPWYLAAGAAAGAGFLSDPPLRLLPLLLLAPLALALARQVPSPRILGLAFALVTCDLVLSPALPELARAGSPGFWLPTAGLGGTTIAGAAAFSHGYAATLQRLVWPPREALFGPLLIPWLLLGLLLAPRQIRRPRVALGLLWALLLLLPAALVAPAQSGRLLAALPLLTALPLAGMRAALRRARDHGQWAARGLAALAALSLAGNLAWAAALNPTVALPPSSTDQAIGLANRLLGPEPVLFSTSGRDDSLAYLAAADPGAAGRLDFDGRALLPIPLGQNGYLISPADTPLDPALAALLAPLALPTLSGPAATVYRIDDRARQALPASIPTTTYTDGAELRGSTLLPHGQHGQLAVLLTWRLPGDGHGRRLRLLLRATQPGIPDRTATVDLPGFPQPTDVVRLVLLDAPPTGTEADLFVSLLDANGQPVPGAGVDTDGRLFLNRYRFTQ